MPSVAERLADRWEATEVSVPTVEQQPTATPAAGKVE
jgi:hypothetical protein